MSRWKMTRDITVTDKLQVPKSKLQRSTKLQVQKPPRASMIGHLPWYFRETSGSAGGLAQFDSSGNDPKRGMVQCAVSPHPDPLPQGEGTARIAQRKAEGSGLSS